MILLNVLCSSMQQAHDLAEVLLLEHLWVDAFIGEEGQLMKRRKKETIEETRVKVQGMTRAVLYDRVNQRIRELYPYDMPILYAVPIVSMDWEQSEHLLKDTSEEE